MNTAHKIHLGLTRRSQSPIVAQTGYGNEWGAYGQMKLLWHKNPSQPALLGRLLTTPAERQQSVRSFPCTHPAKTEGAGGK